MIDRPKLRNYQQAAKKQLYASLKLKKNCLLYLPTGGGKTSVAADISADVAGQFKKLLFVAHRKELINQAHNRLKQYGITAGRIMGSKHKYQGDSVNVASIQTLNNREFPDADVVFIDEAHHCVLESNSYENEDSDKKKDSVFKKFFDHYNGKALIIGLSATPQRLDGKPLGNVFDEIILPVVDDEFVDVRWLQGQGYLVPAVYWGAPIPVDLDKLGHAKGDFKEKDLFERINREGKTLYQGVVENYLKHLPGKKAVCFCINVEHSKRTCQMFLDAGVRAGHLDGTMKDERDLILGRFAAGEIDVLCNVGILTEGYDLPDIDAMICFRPTDSESLWLQMIGRALRPVWPPGFNEHEATAEERVAAIAGSKKPFAVILDHGENCQRLYFAETAREYSLDKPKSKRRGVSPVRECKEVDGGCGRIFETRFSNCPDCGREFINEVVRSGPASVQAELVQLKTGEDRPLPDHLRKLTKDMTLEELEEFRAFKKNHLGWIIHQLKGRAALEAKATGKSEYDCAKRLFTTYANLKTPTKKAYKPSWIYQQLESLTAAFYEN